MKIPIWQGERIEGILRGGRTRPLLVSCRLPAVDDHGEDGPLHSAERRTMLTKALGLPELTDTGLFAEYFGSALALEFGIDAPQAALVDLSSELLAASDSQLKQWGVQPRAGLAVGLEHRRGLLPLARYIPIRTQEEIREAARIYAFDLVAQNPDRRPENPNCGFYGGRLVAYDFEMAFSFLHPIVGGPANPWEVARFSFAVRHIFHRELSRAMRRRELNWRPVRDAVANLDVDRLSQLTEFLPTSWQPLAAQVIVHINAIRMKLDEFEEELRRSLS